jgi:hypothetical protein
MNKKLKSTRAGDKCKLYAARTDSANVRRITLDATTTDTLEIVTDTLKELTAVDATLSVVIRRALYALNEELLRKAAGLDIEDSGDFCRQFDKMKAAERKLLFQLAGQKVKV